MRLVGVTLAMLSASLETSSHVDARGFSDRDGVCAHPPHGFVKPAVSDAIGGSSASPVRCGVVVLSFNPSLQGRLVGLFERWALHVFVLLTIGISWPAWGVLAVYDLEPGLNLAGALWLLGGLGPPLAAVVVVGVTEGIDAVRQLLGRLLTWRVAGRWYAVALMLPGAVVAVALIIDALVYEVSTPLPSLDLLPLFVGSIVANMLIGGGLEEIGWRGFALPRLQAAYSALTASLILGVVWIAWHAPLFVVPGAIQAELSPLPFLIQGLALAVVFTWVCNSTDGSLLLVVLLHGTVNAWLTSVWFLRGDVSATTLWVFAGLLGVVAVSLVVVYGPAHLSRSDRQTAGPSGSDSTATVTDESGAR